MKKAVKLVLISLILAPLTSWGAEDFTLRDLDGEAHRLSDFRGQWVVVNVWATWCPPCREEIPELIFFHDAHAGKDALVLGVNFEELKVDKVRSFLDEYLVSYPILLAEPGREGPLGPIKGLPTTYIVSPEGEVVHTRVGSVDRAYLESALDHLKGQRP